MALDYFLKTLMILKVHLDVPGKTDCSYPVDGFYPQAKDNLKEEIMLQKIKRFFVCVVIGSFTFVGITQSAQAALISTEQIHAANANATQGNLDAITAALERPEVIAHLERLGVSKDDAQARVAALTDAEAAALAGQIDSLPAGGDVVGALVLIFVILLVTDILGLTKVFPFTRSR